MLEVRIALECHAIRMAVPQAAGADLDVMQTLLEAYDAMPGPASWSVMNWRFHSALYRPCECHRLLDAIERNFNRFSSAAREQVSAISGKRRPQREHWKLLELTKAGRADQAASLLEQHIRQTQLSIRAELRLANA